MAAPQTKVSLKLKLLVDTKGDRVVYAEAGKDFVDFLFNLLSLPIGTVIKILSSQSMVGSLGKIYESVEKLDDDYKEASEVALNALLKPRVSTSVAVPSLLPDVEHKSAAEFTSFYGCSRLQNSKCHELVATSPYTKCPENGCYMDKKLSYVVPESEKSRFPNGGYVKGMMTYIITDDLEVRPMSTITSITILNKFNIKDLGVLEEKVVHIGMGEGVELLKATFHSKTVLTDVFLEKKVSTVSVSEVD